MSTGFWGADETNEQKPIWPWVMDRGGNSAANTFATNSGWVMRWPWGDEVIVAIEGLARKLGTANLVAGYDTIAGTGPSLELINAASQSVSFLVSFNEPVSVTGTPTLQMETTGTGSAANVVLTYNAVASDLTAGKVVFDNTSFSLGHADYANTDLVISNTATLGGWDGIKDASTANAVANAIPDTISTTTHVWYASAPQTAQVPFGLATDLTAQVVGTTITFGTGDKPMTVSGTPTILAIATTEVTENLSLAYSAADSNLVSGALVFKLANQDFSALTTNGVYTINSTSTPGGWSGIKDVKGTVVPNGITVANTIPVVKGPVDVKVWANTAPANTATETIIFGVQFDRAVRVMAPVPTLVAISNNQTLAANQTLTYASGNGSNTLIFSTGASANLVGGTNALSFKVNTTSVFGNPSSIYDASLGNTVAKRAATLLTGNSVTVATA